MKIRFWGVSGSIPAPLTPGEYHRKIDNLLEKASNRDLSTPELREAFLKEVNPAVGAIVGGNSSCVDLKADGKHLVFDMGSGIRELGNSLMRGYHGDPLEFHIFMSHTHWDHIQGFPFFKPAFSPKTKLNFYSPHGMLDERLSAQQAFPFFPVSTDFMASEKIYHTFMPESKMELGEIKISNTELQHPNKAYSFRVEHEGKTFVYATDGEYNKISTEKFADYIEFFRDADLLVFDAMYSFDQEIQRIDWGHSSALVGIDLAIRGNVKRLALFHHDPDNDSFGIFKLLDAACSYLEANYPNNGMEVFIATEGYELEL